MNYENLTVREMAKDSHSEFQIYECELKAGSRLEPELLAQTDRMQMFFFLNTTGYVATKKRAWNIEAESLFTPNFNKEPFFIEAGEKDLKFVWFKGVMNSYDEKEYVDYHIILPCMRQKLEGFRYTESFTGKAGSSIETRRLVLDTAFGRWYVGMAEGCGSDAFVAPHTQEHLQQWNYCLPESKFTYMIDGVEHEAEAGDTLFIPKGSEFSAKAHDDGAIRYLWIKFASEGFPVGRDGYPGSEV